MNKSMKNNYYVNDKIYQVTKDSIVVCYICAIKVDMHGVYYLIKSDFFDFYGRDLNIEEAVIDVIKADKKNQWLTNYEAAIDHFKDLHDEKQSKK
jgi:hypothetical protein